MESIFSGAVDHIHQAFVLAAVQPCLIRFFKDLIRERKLYLYQGRGCTFISIEMFAGSEMRHQPFQRVLMRVSLLFLRIKGQILGTARK